MANAQPLTAAERAQRSVFVGNIPYEATEEQLKDIFLQAGPVVSFRLVYDRETGKPKGYGFCEYQDVETAQSAMRNLNNHDFNGRPLRVGVAAGEQNKDEIKSMQQALGGPPVESPYGEPVETEKAPEAISKAVASLPPEQMFELMKQMKLCIQNNPNEARNMLLQNPQLAYALLQAQIVMKIVDPQVALAMLHRQSDQIPPLLPSNDSQSKRSEPMQQSLSSLTSSLTGGRGPPSSGPPMGGGFPSEGRGPMGGGPPMQQGRGPLGAGPGGPPHGGPPIDHRGRPSDMGGPGRGPLPGLMDRIGGPGGGGGRPVGGGMGGPLPLDMDRSRGGGGGPPPREMRDPRMDRMDTRSDRMDPRADRMDPRADRMDPRADRMDTRSDRMDTRSDRMDPRSDRMDTRPDRMDPRSDRMDPRSDRIDPRSDRMDPRQGRGPPPGGMPGGPRPGPGGPGGPVGIPGLGSLTAGAGAGGPGQDQEKAALIMQVLQLTDQQIAMLPPDQRQSILILKEQIQRSGGVP